MRHSPGTTWSSCLSPSSKQHLGTPGLMGQLPLGVPELPDWQRRGLGKLFLKLKTFGPFSSSGAQLQQRSAPFNHLLQCSPSCSTSRAGTGHREGSPWLSS